MALYVPPMLIMSVNKVLSRTLTISSLSATDKTSHYCFHPVTMFNSSAHCISRHVCLGTWVRSQRWPQIIENQILHDLDNQGYRAINGGPNNWPYSLEFRDKEMQSVSLLMYQRGMILWRWREFCSVPAHHAAAVPLAMSSQNCQSTCLLNSFVGWGVRAEQKDVAVE